MENPIHHPSRDEGNNHEGVKLPKVGLEDVLFEPGVIAPLRGNVKIIA